LSRQNESKKRTCVHKDKSNCKPPNESTITHFFFNRYWFREKRGKRGFFPKKRPKRGFIGKKRKKRRSGMPEFLNINFKSIFIIGNQCYD